ncbi:oxidoreductase, short chain dehydrogenase/reductase family protein [Corynebacterium efficiens YS-314]|uniref:Putative oxidoreductase n=1 Tax=Corynebacterium efficiens (strain DSM 44549 / YS-314 / AJ 12310 / JCM 11189 / NBRC 100395) TaxID=196164 RepID=Q8FQK7_COREF|nr:SDR family oxidoreductase [Corynebacterium efficiens]EEW50022.1 oxidoreductase, short chain dehydrogenase/reductase family protein [Corynebacterium efficiens YS-314]BAC17922.1 putative oxidoreductase [Corynebacterium efficiens YS-314]
MTETNGSTTDNAHHETTDQLTFQNPVTRYPEIEPPIQDQPEPGLDADLVPKTDRGEFSYRGTGRLKGRRALITGGDSGIGAAVAIAFAREGADIALNYLPDEEEDAQWVRDVVEKDGRKITLLPGDLADAEFCRQLVTDAVDTLGGLDILVNNAGRQIAQDSLEDLTDEQLEDTFNVNILAMFRITREALKHLEPGSSIVNTTSIQAYQPSANLLDYASTKAAINNFTKGLGQQLAPKGIRVNAVAPGPFWTPLQVSDGQNKEDLPEFGKNTPLGRAGQPTELAPAYVFLASSESSYVIGETLNVNGGTPAP